MEQNNLDLQEKRDIRRKRRRRNQLLAYLTMIVLIAALAAGSAVGINVLKTAGRQQEEVKQDKQDKVDELLSSEESIAEPEPEQMVVELTPEQKLDEIINAGIEVMPLEDKVAGLFVVTPEAITGVSAAIQAGEGTKAALEQYAVGGIVYFSKNMKSKEQLKEMIENTQLYTKYPLFIAVEEEGGSVSPIAEAGLADKTEDAQTLGSTEDAQRAYQAGEKIGAYLAELGFNLDLAPVADLANAENSVIAQRAYGSDAQAVSGFVTSMLKGLQEQRITVCMKHFPGIGSSAEDTHKGLASTDRSREDFTANEFAVFQAGIDAGADMIMVSHMAAPSLSGDNTPCSLSEAVVTGILREELNFKGVIVSDALNMAAISEYYSSEQAAVMALRAGCDMVLMPENFEEAYQGVLKAVQEGTISEERINDSLRRIYRIKYADKLEEME